MHTCTRAHMHTSLVPRPLSSPPFYIPRVTQWRIMAGGRVGSGLRDYMRAHARTCTPLNLPFLLVPSTLPPGNPSMLCGQRSVTVGAGRHGLAEHVRLKRYCEWRQCEVRSISLNSRTHSVYVHRTQPVESRFYCSPLLINFTSHRRSGNVTDIY